MTTGQSLTDDDILRHGYMMIKRPPSSGKVRIKAWHSKFFLLRDLSENSRQRLEYYKDQSTFTSAKPDKPCMKHCIFLDSVIHIGETRTSKTQPHAFMIVCVQQGALTLACSSDQSLKEWLSVLNKVSTRVQSPGLPELWPQETAGSYSGDSADSTPELPRRCAPACGPTPECDAVVPAGQAYPVTTRLTPPAERNKIRGEYMMHVTEQELILKSSVEGSLVVRWPLKFLRAFKNEPACMAGVKGKHLLTLEVGRRTATGEGIFQFFTDCGDEIVSLIRLHSNLVLQTTAADKREVFRRRAMSSNSAHGIQNSTKKTWVKKVSLPAKFGTVEQATAANATEEQTTEGAETLGPLLSSSPKEPAKESGSYSEKLRRVSTTDSSEDDVFIDRSPSASENLPHYDLAGQLGSSDSTYIDLLPDEDAEPIHISDAEPRKGSCSSQVSIVNSEDTKGGTSSASCLSEDSELDSDGYLKGDLSPREKIPGRRTPDPLDEDLTEKLETQPENSANRTSPRNCEDPVAAQTPPNPSSHHLSLHDKNGFKESKHLLDRILAQMEMPQQNDVSELFPNATTPHTRNSVGSVCLDSIDVSAFIPAQTRTHLSPDTPRKHGVVEKTNSEAGNAPRFKCSPGPGPPPLPARPEVAAPRRKSYSALSEMSGELRGKIDLTCSGNPTVFAKRMHKTSSSLCGRSGIPTAAFGGEVMLGTRLLEQSLFAKNSFSSPLSSQNNGEKSRPPVSKSAERNVEVRECVSDCFVIVPKTIEMSENLTSSSEKTVLVTRTFEAFDNKGDEPRKRKDSKASKMVKRFFKTMARSPPDSPNDATRRDSSDSYASEEWSEDDSDRPRRQSLSPGFPMDSRREHTSPESSPLASRKKPKDGKIRKTSREERSMKISKEEMELKSGNISSDERPAQEDKNETQRTVQLSCSQCGLEGEKDESAPALPPRKKSDPPPLPPRVAKSPSNPTGRKTSLTLSKPLVLCPTKETKKFVTHRGTHTCQLNDRPPPPLPPRKENSRSSLKATTEQHDTESAPAIQPDISSAGMAELSGINGTSDHSTVHDEASFTEMEDLPINLSPHETHKDCPVPERPPKGLNLGTKHFLPKQTAVGETVDTAGACKFEDETASITAEETTLALNNNHDKSSSYSFSSPTTEVTRYDNADAVCGSGNSTVLTPDGKTCFVLEDSYHVIDSSSSFSTAFSTEA